MSESLEELKCHIGDSETDHDLVTASVIAKIAATLGRDTPASQPGEAIPPGWHTGFFPPTHRAGNMRADGQVSGGGIMPKVPLPRRRLLGEKLRFHDPLRIGDDIERVTEIADIAIENGDDTDSGEASVALVVRHTINTPRGPGVVEERHFKYLGSSGTDRAQSPPLSPDAAPPWQRVIEPDPVLLFRYSAIRFNSHRIHYDREYAVGIEGCPGLIVQGTLVSQLLLEMCREELPVAVLTEFDYRTLRPIYDTGPITLGGAPDAGGASAALWAVAADGALCMSATARFASI